jgi:hypothetical protein
MEKRAVVEIDAEEDEVPKAKNGRMELNREEGLRSLYLPTGHSHQTSPGHRLPPFLPPQDGCTSNPRAAWTTVRDANRHCTRKILRLQTKQCLTMTSLANSNNATSSSPLVSFTAQLRRRLRTITLYFVKA